MHIKDHLYHAYLVFIIIIIIISSILVIHACIHVVNCMKCNILLGFKFRVCERYSTFFSVQRFISTDESILEVDFSNVDKIYFVF